MKNIVYLLFATCIFLACQQNDTSEQTTMPSAPEEETNTPPVATEVNKSEQPFFIIDNYTGEQDVPKSNISISMRGNKVPIKDAVACESIAANDYKKFKIPEEALEACGGSGAGSSEYFYIIKNTASNYYMIMHTTVDKQNAENDYQYTSLMNIAYTEK